MRIGVLQFQPELFQPSVNRDTLERYLRESELDIAVIPELATTGYFFSSRDQLLTFAEPVTGPTCQMARDLSRDKDMLIILGFAERAGDKVFNSAIAALPDGTWVLYRKTHLFGEEIQLFTPGDTGFQPFPFRDTCVGLMICYDWRFPEAARTLALRGAEIICHPSDLVALPSVWQPVLRTRAVENKIIIATANRNGTEWRGEESLTFHGKSQIVQVNGEVAAECDSDFSGWVVADLDPSLARDKSLSAWNDLFADRRPDLYEHHG